ncbi:hypothetical protein GQ42DRAFT_166098 [Ramicandelaber brevisporus]|nr:hypothetical protein GQ42DRAFT_166098 [Ramicandelaber brevisporus]
MQRQYAEMQQEIATLRAAAALTTASPYASANANAPVPAPVAYAPLPQTVVEQQQYVWSPPASHASPPSAHIHYADSPAPSPPMHTVKPYFAAPTIPAAACALPRIKLPLPVRSGLISPPPGLASPAGSPPPQQKHIILPPLSSFTGVAC